VPGPLGSLDLSLLVRDLPDALITADPEGTIVLVSDAAGRLLGRVPATLVGRPLAALAANDADRTRLASLTDPEPAGADLPGLALAAGTGISHRVMVDGLSAVTNRWSPGGPFVLLSLRARGWSDSETTGDGSWRYFEGMVHLADRMADVKDEASALALILPNLLSELSWDVGCLWLVTSDGRRLVCVATWPDDGGPTRPFEEASRSIRPTVGEGLPGSTWGSGRPLATSVGYDSIRSLRQETMTTCRLQTGLAFPLVTEAGVIGIIEMFSRRSYSISPLLMDGLASIGRQIGQLLDRARAETQLRQEERLRTFLLEAATVLSASVDYADALTRLATISVPEMADLCLIDVYGPTGEIDRMAAVHADPSKAGLVEELRRDYPPLVGGLHPSHGVMASGTSAWSPTMSDVFLRQTTRDERHFELVKALGFDSYMCVPLKEGDDILGAITLVSAGSGRRFQAGDLALPEELANRAASVVAAARRHEREQQQSHQLQRLLLPERLPDIPGFELGVRYATGTPQADAGGDFYDVVPLPGGLFALLIGDVEGHDAVAAATMGQLRSASRALSGHLGNPFELVDALRADWERLGFERIATALCAHLDPTNGAVVMASAGHLQPVHVDRTGRATFVEVMPAPPLGSPGPGARDHWIELAPGELLFLYTDGLVEDRQSGLEQRLTDLLATLESVASQPLEGLCSSVLNQTLGPERQQQDDVAVLAIRRQG
jgi:serine phosphatase RsbU (regulator of sigma subunit)